MVWTARIPRELLILCRQTDRKLRLTCIPPNTYPLGAEMMIKNGKNTAAVCVVRCDTNRRATR
jgi:hypothetical protein